MDIGTMCIEDLLPHRGRMCLVSEILSLEEHRAVTRAVVGSQWPLVAGGEVDALILVELVAQTAGINNGWARVRQRGMDSEKTGWLVGIKKARFFIRSIPLHTPVITYAENHFEYDSFREIHGHAEIDGRRAGEIVLQVFQP